MRGVRVQPGETAVALTAGGWAFAFARSHTVAAAAALALLVTVVLLLVRRSPLVSALVVAAVIALGSFGVGVPGDNPWFLAGALVALYGLGRHTTAVAALPVLIAFWAVFALLDRTMATALFAAVLVAVPWTFGAVLRRRSARADSAREQAAALARVDAAARAEAVVAEERTRLAVEVLAIIREAVERMQAEAADADRDLDPRALAAIQTEGRHATTELRRMLGLLRSEAKADVPAEDGPSTSPWLGDGLASVVLAVVLSLEVTVASRADDVLLHPAVVVLDLWLIGTVALRRVRPGAACLLAVLTPALALVLDLHLGYGLWSGGAAALLVLAAAAQRDRPTWVALATFSTTFVLDVLWHEPENGPITLTTLLLATIAGYGWGDRVRAERAAQADSATMRAAHDAAVDRAVRAERLRVARELHDITSHAVGVMVLQAGAAAALRERDSVRARDAVRVIRSTAAEALAQVDGLRDVLDAGAVGPPGMAGAVPATDLEEAVTDLVERVRQAGSGVTLELVAPPMREPAVVATAYRVVQESLTNAMRHAPGSGVQVAVQHADDHLVISVRDDGAHSTAVREGREGFGLVGLAERVTALGGELRAGPRAGGGFEVWAVLPVHDSVETRP